MGDDTAGHAGQEDPRPLVGEPVSLDLLNTVWIGPDGRHDLLEDIRGLRIWLRTNHLDHAPDTDATLDALVRAREDLRTHLDVAGERNDGARAAAETRLNDVLAAGNLVRSLEGRNPGTRVTVARPELLAAWTAVEDYLQLLSRDPARIRRCAHPDCVLHFYDTSKRGDRRWCSMAGCGNRAKAARHYARTRGASAD